MTKRFLYLVQTAGDLPEKLVELQSTDSDVRFLSWQKQSSDPRSLFYPDSSWTQGRNRLLREAPGTGYCYYVFLDDDILLEAVGGDSGQNPWRLFEEFLLDYEPAIGMVRYSWQLTGGWDDPAKPVQSLRFFDALLNAFHREALLSLLPYYDGMDEESECYAQAILCSLAASLYPSHLLQTNRLTVKNLKSRRMDREYANFRPDEFILACLRDPREQAAFLRMTVGEGARHVRLGEPKKKEGRSYVVSAAELERRYRTDHPLWQRKRELLDLPAHSDFWGEGPDTERARQWRAATALRRRSLVQRIALRTAPWRVRCGLTRHAFQSVSRRLGNCIRRSGPVEFLVRCRWVRWWKSEDLFFAVRSPDRPARWLAYCLGKLPCRHLHFLDAGFETGDPLQLAKALLPPEKRILALGVGPEGYSRYRCYSGFVETSAARGEDTPVPDLAAMVRQFALEGEVLHFVKIGPACGPAASTFMSLGEKVRDCLFVQLIAPGPAGILPEAAGFRLLAVANPSKGECGRTYVNTALFRRIGSAFICPIRCFRVTF